MDQYRAFSATVHQSIRMFFSIIFTLLFHMFNNTNDKFGRETPVEELIVKVEPFPIETENTVQLVNINRM